MVAPHWDIPREDMGHEEYGGEHDERNDVWHVYNHVAQGCVIKIPE